MLVKPALALLNHILGKEEWALARLLGFAGQAVRLEFGGKAWVLRISAGGLLETAEEDLLATVSVRLPDDAPVRALTDRASLFSAATISGSAELAETLGFVLRNLHWDVEHDLAQPLGDVVARRALLLARGLARWQLQSARKLAVAVADYFTEEQPIIARRRDIEWFCSEVDALHEDCSLLAKRLARAEQR